MKSCLHSVSCVLQAWRGTSLTTRQSPSRSTSSQSTTCGITCTSSSWWRWRTRQNTPGRRATWRRWSRWVRLAQPLLTFQLRSRRSSEAFSVQVFPCPPLGGQIFWLWLFESRQTSLSVTGEFPHCYHPCCRIKSMSPAHGEHSPRDDLCSEELPLISLTSDPKPWPQTSSHHWTSQFPNLEVSYCRMQT